MEYTQLLNLLELTSELRIQAQVKLPIQIAGQGATKCALCRSLSSLIRV